LTPDLNRQDLDWTPAGPRSRRYDDIYFSPQDGLAESRAVFLQGCGLPDAWAGRTRFTVAELGFGTGLNIAALLHLWTRTRPPGARLSLFSVEAHLLAREEAARALCIWREDIGDATDALLAAWPDARKGFHRLDLPAYAATLDLYVGEAADALQAWGGPADAWFLDGFAPVRNPDMWRDEVMAAVARLSAPGARLASFTVAGHVRRALAANGLAVEKRPGFGRKRERLEARRPGVRSPSVAPASVLVLGAGIAGASLVRALAREGVGCTVLEATGAGAGASGNPAALVTPRLDAGFGPAAELHAQAFSHAVALYRRETAGAILAEGALQLGAGARDADRFRRLAGWSGFAPDRLQPMDALAAAGRLGEGAEGASAALLFADALVLEPAQVLAPWLERAERRIGEVARLERRDGLWTCLDEGGAVLAQAHAVCVATGAAASALLPALALRPVRGQLEFTGAPVFDGVAAAWGAYAIPLGGGGALWGASHVRGETARDLRPAEAAANLRALAARRPVLARRIEALPPDQVRSRAAVRAATADHMPLAGEVEPGLHVLSGLGGRGFTLAPLLAEHLAAGIVGAPSPLPDDLSTRMRPLRFA
jgi:tRNA 5-methylaminomethyl-2-thiouridine biosynthesis bifunctional protein